MRDVIHDIGKLSDNRPLFDALAHGHDLQNLPVGAQGLAPTPKAELFGAVRTAMVSAFVNDNSKLQAIISTADIPARVTVAGELILAAHALNEGKHPNETRDRIARLAFDLARGLASALEAAPPLDSDNQTLLEHAIALREWAHLLAEYYRDLGVQTHWAEMLMVRARVTNCTLSGWPNLVGAAMVDVALAVEPLGKQELTVQCCNGVRMDLRYLIDRVDDPSLPEFEKISALYWLQQACAEVARIQPGDASAKEDLETVRALRQARQYRDTPSAPRLGPIARTYLADTPYLALILRNLQESYDASRHDDCVAAICARFGCPATDVDFYLSAMGSHAIRDTVLRGVRTFYDDAHQRVFAAIEYLKQHPQA
jgi:hypothetical protein